jgi:hypothetical protein
MTIKHNKQRRERSEQRDARIAKQRRERQFEENWGEVMADMQRYGQYNRYGPVDPEDEHV